MGCSNSAPIVDTGEPLVIDDVSRRKFNILNLDDHSLKILWKAFCAINAIEGGTENRADEKLISSKQFHKFYELVENRFTKLVFSRMDHEDSGFINFEDYVISVWDFLSSDTHHFVFHLYDVDGSKSLKGEELEELVRCAYGIESAGSKKGAKATATRKLLNKTTTMVLDVADLNGDGKITYAEFEAFVQKNELFEHPGSELRGKLLRSNGGEGIWAPQRRHRQETHNKKSVHKILGYKR
jgi:Ca2+-binding EF-hand superfamily protein